MKTERKPIPGDFYTTAYSAADIMVILNETLGIPLRALIVMEPQPLYELLLSHLAQEDLDAYEHLIIVDDETGDMLKQLMRDTVDRLRPENRGVAHDVGVMSRSAALARLDGEIPDNASLTAIEMALWTKTGDAQVVLEDVDDADYSAAMNRIISERLHGRSRKLD
jgi:hypothetical protein